MISHTYILWNCVHNQANEHVHCLILLTSGPMATHKLESFSSLSAHCQMGSRMGVMTHKPGSVVTEREAEWGPWATWAVGVKGLCLQGHLK